jgi:CubicO group peptidase (beta-lactamase class C family)
MLNFYQMEKSINKIMQESNIPGLALAIVQEHKLIYAKGFGVTSVEDGGLPVTPETLFRIGSITKSLTGTAIMRLVEAGKLDLDTPIKTYIDWFRLSDPEATEQVTLRMLLSHTSGLPTDGTNGQYFGQRDPHGLEKSVREEIPEYALIAPHNRVMSYSNPGISLAGYVAEVVSGKPYAELMQDLVFEPLKMQRTTFDPTIALTYPSAQSHDLDDGGKLHVQHHYADYVAHYPAGFAISTVTDMANFAIMHMQQGEFQGQHILTPESVREMHKPQVSLYTSEDTAYALTFFLKTYKGMQQIWHDGGISTFGGRLVLFPEQGTAVIMVFNRWLPTIETITDNIIDKLLSLPEQKANPPIVEPDRSLWSGYSGSYLGFWHGLAQIEVVNDCLTLKKDNDIILLQAIRQDLYIGYIENRKTPISIGFPSSTKPAPYIYVNCFIHKRTELTTAPDPDKWKNYEGIYTRKGRDTYTIRLADNELRIYSKTDKLEVALLPLDATRFSSSWSIFEFVSDDNGRVIAVMQGPGWIFEKV